ncbi:MAG: hypothetical protein K8I27_01000 [Planctomycetes bacterium]|nr:hypothetical protein [Planctomycetota bacterium]
MRYVFRATTILLVLGFLFTLSLAQKSLKEIPDGAGDDLTKDGDREAHQGADNPQQGNRGPDPYSGETYQDFIEKAERKLNDPQWQLKLDMADPQRIVINHADGSAQEYWYVLFRVINDNTRNIKSTTLPGIDTSEVNLDRPPGPRKVEGGTTDDLEGVPVSAHLDFEFHTFSQDMEKYPGDTAWPVDPEDEVINDEARELRRSNMKHIHKPVSNHFVLQKIAEKEGLYEWMGNYGYINEAVMLLHPLSDFQRQIGPAHNLDAPDLSGLRCLPYRTVTVKDGDRVEATRYVAVYGDDTFAGLYGEGDPLPDGARLIKDSGDDLWGKLTQRRYMAGDCVDRWGRPLRANDPGYLNARIAGGRDPNSGNFGVLGAEHPLVDQPVLIPHYRLYKSHDRVLVGWDTGVKHAEIPNTTYRISGKIVGPADARYGDAQEAGGLEMFGGDVEGRPVKVVDKRGRAVRRYLVTYEAGDVVSQGEWDIWRARLGEGLLSRYSNTGDIVGRALTADDPLIGLPKIKMGRFIGGEAGDSEPEVIQRGIDTGRRGPQGEVILEVQDYTTGRRYSPKLVDPEDFARDPEGEFSTHRVAPVPSGANLHDGEEYVYAPLGTAQDDAVPVPAFDQYGAWRDYYDELSGARIPLTDSQGNLVRDSLDQILYLKEFEYEYVYLYEYEPLPQQDEGFKGQYGGDRFELQKKSIKFTRTRQKVQRMRSGSLVEEDVEIVLPLVRLIWEERTVSEPVVVDGYEVVDGNGKVRYVTADEYAEIKGAAPGDDVVKVKIVTSKMVPTEVVVGVWDGSKRLEDNQRGEDWAEAERRATHLPDTWDESGNRVQGEINPNVTVEDREVIEYVDRFRNEQVVKEGNQDFTGTGPRSGEFGKTDEVDNGIDQDQTYQTWSRWTVPPPLVFRNDDGQWEVLTRLADKIGPANRWDGTDAPRFLTRYISEMWGVAIFEDVGREWDFANVYVRGLRGQVSNAGLEIDATVPDMPSPADGGGTKVSKAFFNPRYVAEEWVYRTRFERLGDEFENYRDLIKRVRTFWYRESDRDLSGE